MSSFILDPQDFNPSDQASIRALLEETKETARPDISNFYVSALAIGESGTGYLGVNLEFVSQPLSMTVHAEQFAVALARLHGETGLRHLYVSETPCGHCRQFLLETGQPSLPITALQADSVLETTLSELLPHPFSLADQNQGFFSNTPISLKLTAEAKDELIYDALEAASRAYVPYTKAFSGVAIQTQEGHVYTGSTLESAAFNPTLNSIQAALIELVAHDELYHAIASVVLVEDEYTKLSMAPAAVSLIRTFAPCAQFNYVSAIHNEM